jgi:hypothetical protein
MNFFIEYPLDWVGIPRFGDGQVFATPEAWADALVREIAGDARPRLGRKERAGLADALALIARGFEEGGAQSGYVWLESHRGPLHPVALTTMPRSAIGDASASEIAGARGDGDYVPPIVRDVVVDSGAAGAYVERHAPLDSEAVHVATVSGVYAFPSDEGVVVLSASTTDFAGYERFRPHFEELAQTFRWGEG